MKKKHSATTRDKKAWISFTKQLENVPDKDEVFIRQNTKLNKMKTLDLHGFSLNEANKLVKKFIIESFKNGYKKLLIITGKGLGSKVHQNPYLSEQMNVLKHSVPEFIKNDEDLFEKISRISTADLKMEERELFIFFLRK